MPALLSKTTKEERHTNSIKFFTNKSKSSDTNSDTKSNDSEVHLFKYTAETLY